jgi:hypothetical protein
MCAYLGVFVGGLLPLLGHGLGQGLAEQVDNVEDTERGESELGHLEEDLPALTLGSLGTGTVGTESDPVSCRGGEKILASRKGKELMIGPGFKTP